MKRQRTLPQMQFLRQEFMYLEGVGKLRPGQSIDLLDAYELYPPDPAKAAPPQVAQAAVAQAVVKPSTPKQPKLRQREPIQPIRLLTTIGGVLIGLGLISFIVSNWSIMGDYTKFGILLTLFALFMGAGRLFEGRNEKLSRVLYSIGAATYVSESVYLGSLFELSGSPGTIFALWAIGLAPLALYMRNHTLKVVTLIFAYVYIFLDLLIVDSMMHWITPVALIVMYKVGTFYYSKYETVIKWFNLCVFYVYLEVQHFSFIVNENGVPWVLIGLVPALFFAGDVLFKDSERKILFGIHLALSLQIITWFVVTQELPYEFMIPLIYLVSGAFLAWKKCSYYEFITIPVGSVLHFASAIYLSFPGSWDITNGIYGALALQLVYIALGAKWLKSNNPFGYLVIATYAFFLFMNVFTTGIGQPLALVLYLAAMGILLMKVRVQTKVGDLYGLGQILLYVSSFTLMFPEIWRAGAPLAYQLSATKAWTLALLMSIGYTLYGFIQLVRYKNPLGYIVVSVTGFMVFINLLPKFMGEALAIALYFSVMSVIYQKIRLENPYVKPEIVGRVHSYVAGMMYAFPLIWNVGAPSFWSISSSIAWTLSLLITAAYSIYGLYLLVRKQLAEGYLVYAVAAYIFFVQFMTEYIGIPLAVALYIGTLSLMFRFIQIPLKVDNKLLPTAVLARILSYVAGYMFTFPQIWNWGAPDSWNIPDSVAWSLSLIVTIAYMVYAFYILIHKKLAEGYLVLAGSGFTLFLGFLTDFIGSPLALTLYFSAMGAVLQMIRVSDRLAPLVQVGRFLQYGSSAVLMLPKVWLVDAPTQLPGSNTIAISISTSIAIAYIVYGIYLLLRKESSEGYFVTAGAGFMLAFGVFGDYVETSFLMLVYSVILGFFWDFTSTSVATKPRLLEIVGRVLHGVGAFILTFSSVWVFSDPDLNITAAGIVGIAYIVYTLTLIKQNDLIGIIIFSIYTFRYYIDLSSFFLNKSITFIVGGIILVALGIWFEKLRKKGGSVK